MYKILIIMKKTGSNGYAIASEVLEYDDRAAADGAFLIIQDSRRHGSDITTLLRLY